MKQSSIATSCTQNKRLLQKSPPRSSKPGNPPINQFFSSKKPNQSVSPSRKQKAAPSDNFSGAPDENFYDPLQMEMEIDEDEEEVSITLKDANQQSDENSSSESSGILHPVIPQNVNDIQTPDTSNADNTMSELNQDRQKQAAQEHQQQAMDDQQRQATGNLRNMPERVPQNPYRKQTSGRGGGLSRINISPNNARTNIIT